jgi:hypothetical protein
MTSPLFPHWKENEIARPVSFAGCWFVVTLSLIAILCMVISPASADNNTTNSTNMTFPDPIVLSFMGGHMFGENPVEIFENNTHQVFYGNTSSKGINLSPDDEEFTIRVEPAGISDAINAPDSGMVGVMTWAEKNPFGTLFGATVIAAIAISLKRKR